MKERNMLKQMATILASIVALSACVESPTNTTTSAIQPAAEVIVSTRSFEADLNSFRATQGKGPVRQNAQLARGAQAHAEDMVRRGYFSHKSPGGPNGANFSERSQAAGCQLRAGAENIANGQLSEAEVLEAWKNSPGHRRNMLVESFMQYGLGRSGNVWVLVFSASC
jgi:uncharacterized protein YkwD